MLSWTGREEWIEIMIVRDQGKIAVTSLTMWDYLMRANQCCAGEARRIRVVAKSLRPQLQGELKVPTVTDRRQMWQAWFLLLKLDLPPRCAFRRIDAMSQLSPKSRVIKELVKERLGKGV